MSAKDFRAKLAAVDTEIGEAKKQKAALVEKKSAALRDTGDPIKTVNSLQQIRDEIAKLDARCEDLATMRGAVEGKLEVFRNNAPKAPTIRKRIAGELWPKTVQCYSEIQQHLMAISKILVQLEESKGEIASLCAEHERLVGERIVGIPEIPSPSLDSNPFFEIPNSFSPPTLREILGRIKLASVPETIKVQTESEK